MGWRHTVMASAFAKVNLTLEVLGRRDDGFHELASVMQTVSLHDTVALRPAADGARSLVCDQRELAGADNLALRAAEALAREAGIAQDAKGVALELRKEIPIQGGLGGGSSDAATVLLALTRLWKAGLPASDLTALAASLGSDVPFFLVGGTALVTGRGEHVAPLPDMDPLWIVLARPAVPLSTASAFQALTPADYGDGSASAALADAIRRGEPPPLTCLANTFERSVLRDYPAVARTWGALSGAGAPIVRLSGSGPTLFAPFDTLASAAEVWQRLRADGHQTWLTHTVIRSEAVSASGRWAETE